MIAIPLVLLGCMEADMKMSYDTGWYETGSSEEFGETNETEPAMESDSDDNDEDGFLPGADDCDDNDTEIYPGAEEVCDGVDNNCDGQIDEGVLNLYFIDADGDGVGSDSQFLEACEPPQGYSETFTDCDDSDPFNFPQNIEICDNQDNNCDEQIDEGVQIILYVDNDGDGIGVDDGNISEGCTEGNGFSQLYGDCDDTNSDVYPNAEEVCDELDNNCNEQIDEGVTDLYFVDNDNDGYGFPTSITEACDVPEGYSQWFTDCDDNDSGIYPQAEEICDDSDNNCDGQIDEGVTTLFFQDLDQDGYGNEEVPLAGCSLQLGLSDNWLDCDDLNTNIHPDATEICDGIDNNCDEQIDEEVQDVFYLDFDQDGYGDLNEQSLSCTLPEGYTENSSDCVDDNAQISPEALEICDEIDNDCDELIDLEIDEGPLWYLDEDIDGFGHETQTTMSCLIPEGYVDNNVDCDDLDKEIFPNQQESCDGVDENCDGFIDNEATNEFTWYYDGDGDSFGTTVQTQLGCEQPENYTLLDGDCDDQDNDIYTGAIEICNGEDDDCDELIDENVQQDSLSPTINLITIYEDADGDHYGNPQVSEQSCDITSGFVVNDDDCDDSIEDADQDEIPDGSLIHPDAIEVCDEVDNNCDDEVDNNAIDAQVWYYDFDGDFYGDVNVYQINCEQPDNYYLFNTDCDDDDSNISPLANEIWYDGIDQNCDNKNDYDQDGDGYISDMYGGDDCDDTTEYIGNNCEFGNGNDGEVTVTTSNFVVNDYMSVQGSVFPGTSTIPLDDTSPLAVGDEILLIQMQGEEHAGLYEFHFILEVESSSITLQDQIAETYTTNSPLQVVRVPNYESLTINPDSSIVASDWDGSIGGIVALRVSGSLQVDGMISASEKGYRGGIALSNTSYWNGYTGETIVPSTQLGNNQNLYGGGGSSYCSCGEAAGAGGYGSPGEVPQGNSCSNEAHGNSGEVYGTSDLSFLYLGSGGGGGCRDDEGCEYTVGRDGGGIVIVAASELLVNGTIEANGEDANGGNEGEQCDDTIGGAGAGGSVYIIAQNATLNDASIQATGGGSTYISQSEVTTGKGGDGRIRVDFSTLNNSSFGEVGASDALFVSCIPVVGHSSQYIP